MHFVTDILVAVLTVYLAFTNGLALQISNLIDGPSSEVIQEEIIEAEVGIETLPGLFTNTIPDILLRSTKYQSAALAGSEGLVGANTKDPFDAMVNIFCTMLTEDQIRTTTGTGFFIDPDGIILTNAHVAQFLY